MDKELNKFETKLCSDSAHDAAFASLLKEVHEKKKSGTKRYGETAYNSLGIKGIFVDINRKYQRLKRWFWDSEPGADLGQATESIEDTLLDFAAYCLLMLMEYRRTNRQEMSPPSKKERKTIAIDFDATIAIYTGWKGKGVFGPPVPGVKEALERFRKEGALIIINTTRSEIDEVRKYLQEHHLPFDYINYNPANQEQQLSGAKVLADVYIDDRAIGFGGRWTDEYVERVLSFKPHWKREREAKPHEQQ